MKILKTTGLVVLALAALYALSFAVVNLFTLLVWR